MGTSSSVSVKGKPAMNIAIAYILVAVAASAVGQILLKKGMTSMGPLTLTPGQLVNVVWGIATNPYVVIGLIIYVGGTLFWLVALSRVALSFAYPFASISYIVMLLASWWLFKEDISLIRIIGTVVVGLGVLIISRS